MKRIYVPTDIEDADYDQLKAGPISKVAMVNGLEVRVTESDFNARVEESAKNDPTTPENLAKAVAQERRRRMTPEAIVRALLAKGTISDADLDAALK